MMSTLFESMRDRQTWLEDLVQKGQYAETAKFSRDFAVINKSCGVAAYMDSTAKLDKVSEKDAISWWTVSTPAMDREGDILEPLGCLEELVPFTKAPVVDYDHRKAYPLPVGKSIGDGFLPLIVTEQGVRAGCLHHGETQFADEVARLVFKGLLSACSVAFIPIIGERLNKSHGGDRQAVTPRFRFRRWQPTAWSICPVGVNQEAVRSELSRGIKSEELRKSLEPYAEATPIWSPGFSFEETMKEFSTIDQDHVGAIRFHKSKFADEAACQKWLFEKGLDGSSLVTNDKSLDFLQSTEELAETSDKVDDGVYVVYLKAFPPKKRKPLSDDPKEKPPAKQPPFQKKDAKPDAKKPDDAPLEDADAPEADPESDPEADDLPVDAKDQEAESEEEDESAEDEKELAPDADVTDDQMTTPNQDAGIDQSGSLTHAGQALVDIAKHKAGELRFYQQSLQAHDHDGLKALMMQAMKNCQRDYDQWMAGAKRLFPHINFDQLASIDQGDDQLGEGDMDNPGDDQLGLDPQADQMDPLKKSLDELDDAAWGDLAITLALESVKDM